MYSEDFKPRSFWKKPEGKTGIFFLGSAIAGLGYLLYKLIPVLITIASNTLQLSLLLAGIGALLFLVMDSRSRNLIGYMYKSIMRWITSLFVQIDPIGVLKTYISDLKVNLVKMNKHIESLKSQMRKLKDVIDKNEVNIKDNMKLASKAKESDKRNLMILKARKAGRLKESNLKLDGLYKKLEVIYRVLLKMYENSGILIEDIEDQVEVKKQEREAMLASHSAMKSAMSIINGNDDKREMFDQALEVIANDVSMKIGEMERFMELSGTFLDSIDLQNYVFEEEGLELLEKWEKEGVSLLLGDEKDLLVYQANSDDDKIDLDAPLNKKGDNYDELFNF